MTASLVQIPRAPIKYIAELFKLENWSPTLSTAPNNYERYHNIYHFSIAPLKTIETDPDNYWIDIFEGYFDNPVGFGVQLYMNFFLTQVFLESILLITENSFWVDDINNLVYMNIIIKPWQFYNEYAALYGNPGSTFSSAPKNENNLSDNKYGIVSVQPRLSVPTLSNELSDAISGSFSYNSFTINVDNSDGFYDTFNILGYFNTPVVLRKTSEDVETIQEFDIIRSGLVSDIQVGFDQMVIEGCDQIFSFKTDFCRKFTLEDYPNIDEGTINNDIPVGWGTLTKIEPIEVNKDDSIPPEWIDYIALDPLYITDVTACYDEDGNELDFSFYPLTGIIRVTELDVDGEVIEAESMTVVGNVDNKIGEIIIKSLSDKENKPYTAGIWDITETDLYLDICASINFYFKGGTTRDLINAVLKNDNAFLNQKNNNLLTIRQWGQTYQEHYIPSWLLTKKPVKNFKDAYKYFLSSILILYQKNYLTNKYLNTYLNDEFETIIQQRYRRSFTPLFETDLDTLEAVEDLASRLINRFGNLRETVSIGVGANTFGINLLDTVEIELEINDRVFSPYSKWIVKKADPGQDTLVLEGTEINYILTFDDCDATLDDDYLWAISGTEIS